MNGAEFTSLDILFLTLAVATVIGVIILTVFFIHAILLLRDVRKITSVMGEVTNNVHGLVMKPVSMVSKIVETVSPHVEDFAKAQAEKLSKRKGKKKS